MPLRARAIEFAPLYCGCMVATVEVFTSPAAVRRKTSTALKLFNTVVISMAVW